MRFRFPTAFCILGILCGSICFAQNYRCEWSVTGISGGGMSPAAYECGATTGQTAAGLITGQNYWALVGYWLPEPRDGVQDSQGPSQSPLVTRLYGPQPNPFRTGVAIRYSLAGPERVTLRVYDQAGKVVREFPTTSVKGGMYSVNWDGRDNRARTLANGIYFCRLQAGNYRATEKLVVQR
jgi:hypothetical protein